MSPTARLGAFMLAALIILGIFIVKIEEIPIGSKAGRQRVQAVFPTVAGLDEKSPVRVAGVRVGIVEKIQLSDDHALVTLALERDVHLHQGAWAAITSLGMLGDKYVELFPGPPGNPPLPVDAVLQGTSPVPFDDVLKTANGVGGDLKAITESLRRSLGGAEGEQRLNEILENIRKLTEDTRTMVAANRGSIDATIENFRDFSQTLKDELPRLADKLNGLADRVDTVIDQNRGNLSASLENIKDLSAQLRVSADNLNQITGKIARGEGSIGKLVNDDETVNNINSTLKSVESGIQTLKNTIGRAERWRLDVNVRSELLPSLPKDHRTRSAFGFDLHTTPHRFYRIELVDSPFGRQEERSQTITTTYQNGHEETLTQAITKTSQVATINAQIGYLFEGYTLRAGLFESKGGVGVDKDLLKQRLRLSFDAYDFNRDEHAPHLRLEGRYYLTHNLFAFAGIDDPTWSQRRSVLLGGGVTWGDEDLKYLLGTAAAAKP
jgi:phospholipid/cholesterol/gamma-HCH transport system substrate-binding protein